MARYTFVPETPYPQGLSRAGWLARLHLIAPPATSLRAVAARTDQSRISGWFTARRLGMTPAQIVASRTKAIASRNNSPWRIK